MSRFCIPVVFLAASLEAITEAVARGVGPAFGTASENVAGNWKRFRSAGHYRILGALPFEFNDIGSTRNFSAGCALG